MTVLVTFPYPHLPPAQMGLTFLTLCLLCLPWLGAGHGSGDDDAHLCMHDHIVSSTRQAWKARGLHDHFEAHDLHTVTAMPRDHHARTLSTYSPIRIKVMTDLLENGAYVNL